MGKITCYKNVEVLLVASKEVGLEGNAGKTKCSVTCCGKTAGKFHSIKTGRYLMFIGPCIIVIVEE